MANVQRIDNGTYLTLRPASGLPATPSDDDLAALYAYPDALDKPWIRVNFVSSIDGAVTDGDTSGGLGTPSDKAVFDTLRALADAVLVGSGTVRAENYGGVQLPDHVRRSRVAAGMAEIPPVVIVTSSGHVEPDSRVVTDTEVPPVVVTTESAPVVRVAALRSAGATVMQCPGESVTSAALVAALTDLGLLRVLCEGGPGLFGQLIADDAVDELCVTTSPSLVAGGSGRIAHSPDAAPRSMKPAHILADDDGTLLVRWVRSRD